MKRVCLLVLLLGMGIPFTASAIDATECMTRANNALDDLLANSLENLSVSCKSTGKGGYRLIVSQDCGVEDNIRQNAFAQIEIKPIGENGFCFIDVNTSSFSACPVSADSHEGDVFDSKQEMRAAKRQLAKDCRAYLRSGPG